MEAILLHKGYYVLLTALSLGWGYWAWQVAPGMVATLRGLSRRMLLAALLLVLLGVSLRLLAPRALQVYYDEFYYVSTAHNLATTQTATYFWQDTPLQRHSYTHFFPPYPAGWSWVLSWLFLLLPPSLSAAQNLSLVLSCLSLPVIFGAAYWYWGKAPAALVALAGLAVLPVSLKLAKSAALEGPNGFFLLLAAAATFYYLRYPGRAAFYCSCLSFSLWLQFRPENLLLLPVYLYGVRRELKSGSAWVCLGLSLLPLGVIYATALHYPQLAEHFKSLPRQGVPSLEAQFFLNFWHNLGFYGSNSAHPLILSLGWVAGLVLQRNARGYTLALWWLALMLFLAAFPFGDLACVYSLDSWRFSLALYLPFLLLSAEGLAGLATRFSGAGAVLVQAGLLALLLSSWLPATAFVNRSHPYLAQYQWLMQLPNAVPPRSWVITEHPDFALALTYGARQPALLRPGKQEALPPGYKYYLVTADLQLEKWQAYHLTLIRHFDAPGLGLSLWRLSP